MGELHPFGESTRLKSTLTFGKTTNILILDQEKLSYKA